MIGQITKLISPSFYRHQYAEMIKRTKKDIAAGSIAPLFKSMLLIGTIGYTMEYMNHGSKSYHTFE